MGAAQGTMSSTADRIISRMVDCLSARRGVRGIALVGSRAHPDRSRVDPYSDADFLVCCEDDERPRLLSADWVSGVEAPVLIFPPVVDDEMRILFQDLFACELHILTLTELERLSGPCRVGSYLASAFSVLYDPDGHLGRLHSRVQPEPPESRDPSVASSAFWYDAAYCANLILRGDLFRAGQFTNWYLQLFLLDLFFSIEEPDATKYVARKLRPEQYEALAGTVSPLTRECMIGGLRRCMWCYWQFQRELYPNLDPALLASYRVIEQEIERRFAALRRTS